MSKVWTKQLAAMNANVGAIAPARVAERAAEISGDDPFILAVLGAVHTFARKPIATPFAILFVTAVGGA